MYTQMNPETIEKLCRNVGGFPDARTAREFIIAHSEQCAWVRDNILSLPPEALKDFQSTVKTKFELGCYIFKGGLVLALLSYPGIVSDKLSAAQLGISVSFLGSSEEFSPSKLHLEKAFALPSATGYTGS